MSDAQGAPQPQNTVRRRFWIGGGAAVVVLAVAATLAVTGTMPGIGRDDTVTVANSSAPNSPSPNSSSPNSPSPDGPKSAPPSPTQRSDSSSDEPSATPGDATPTVGGPAPDISVAASDPPADEDCDVLRNMCSAPWAPTPAPADAHAQNGFYLYLFPGGDAEWVSWADEVRTNVDWTLLDAEHLEIHFLGAPSYLELPERVVFTIESESSMVDDLCGTGKSVEVQTDYLVAADYGLKLALQLGMC